MIALALDASTYTGTVAVLRDGTVVASAETAMRGEREERLMPAVAATLEAAGVPTADLTLVVCGAGPGSFTSLRIAGSIAKGIAFAHQLPLHAVSSLVLAVAAAEPVLADGRYLCTLDALRGQVYAQLVVIERGQCAPAGAATLVDAEALGATATSLDAVVVGSAGSTALMPHARGLARLAPAPGIGAPVDASSWEPQYGRLAEAQVRWEAAHGRPLTGGA